MIVYVNDPDLTPILLTYLHRRSSGEAVRIYLAEGDSWFSIGGATSSLLMALDGPDRLIVSCAYPGDTLRNMSDFRNDAFLMMVSDHFDVKWDAVLLSAGGNDLLGNIGSLIDGVNLGRAQVRSVLGEIDAGYRSLVESVRKYHRCPIHAHTYDYPVSDWRGGWFRLGPWVGNRLTEQGIIPQRHSFIITSLIDALAGTILGVDGLTVHDTRGTLTPAEWGWFGGQRHWRNEIHPSVAGYRLIAARWGLS